jgi:hypothetical protein
MVGIEIKKKAEMNASLLPNSCLNIKYMTTGIPDRNNGGTILNTQSNGICDNLANIGRNTEIAKAEL